MFSVGKIKWSTSCCKIVRTNSSRVKDKWSNVLFQILSRDHVTVSVDAVVYYRVSDPVMAENNVEDYRWLSRLYMYLFGVWVPFCIHATLLLLWFDPHYSSINRSATESLNLYTLSQTRLFIDNAHIPIQLKLNFWINRALYNIVYTPDKFPVTLSVITKGLTETVS